MQERTKEIFESEPYVHPALVFQAINEQQKKVHDLENNKRSLEYQIRDIEIQLGI